MSNEPPVHYEPPVEGADEEQRPAPEANAPVEPPPSEDIDDQEVWAEEEELDSADQAYAADEGWEPGPPPAVAAPRARGGGLASALAVIILALGLVGMTAWGIKLHRDKAAAAGAASQLLALVSAGAPAEMVKQLTSIQTDLSAGNIQSANDQIAALKAVVNDRKTGGGEAGLMGSKEPIPESAYSDLPADAARFFRDNEELFRRFLMMCTRARQMRDEGKNVEALRKIRDEVTEAARLGQKEVVEQKMLKMLQMLGGKGPQGGGGDARAPLAAKAQQLRRATEQARSQGRDIRPVFMLMRQAEQAAQGGDLVAAGKYLDQALVAAKRAPKMSRGDMARMRLGGGARRMAGMANPLGPMVRELLMVMGAEEENLRRVSDDLLSARGILFGDKPAAEQPELLKPVIDKAMNQLTVVADRRKQLQMKMQQGRRPNGKPLVNPRLAGRGRQVGGPQMTPEERQGMLAIVGNRVGLVLDRMRKLSDEDYARDRKLIVKEVLQAVFAPPTAEERAQLHPVKPVTPEARAEAVRANMLKAAPVLRTWETEGKDTRKIDDLFTQARKDLYANKLDDAEKSVNEGMSLLGLAPPPALGPAPTTAIPEPIKIDLRAK